MTNSKVALKIVDLLRSSQAFHNSNGVTLNSRLLSASFSCSSVSVHHSLNKLLDSGVVIHKSGQIRSGLNRHPAYFVLAEGFETSDSWKEKIVRKKRIGRKKNVGVDTQNTVTPAESRPKHVRGPKITLNSVELAQKYSESLQEIAPLKTANNELREQVLSLLNENKTLKDSNEKLQSEIEELKTSEHLATVDLMKANAEIRTLTSTILAEDKRKEMLQRRINNFNR